MDTVLALQRRKWVAVVGGGPAGLAFLRAFKESGLDWEVVLFEARDQIGGVWLVTVLFECTNTVIILFGALTESSSIGIDRTMHGLTRNILSFLKVQSTTRLQLTFP